MPPLTSLLACRRVTRSSRYAAPGEAAPLRWLHPRALGASRGFVALATPPFPLPSPGRSSASQPPTLRAVHAPSAEAVHRGAPTLLSEMHAQFLREESWLRSAA